MAAGDQSGEGPRPLRSLSLGRAAALAAATLVLAGAIVGATAVPGLPEALATSGPQGTAIQLPTLSVDAPLYSIAIDTTGYQAELDKCDWVRMDLTAAAPIVGAHNYCGGDVVLGMQPGHTVVLTGEGLDGTYVVTEIRDAVAGGSASLATAGMTVAAILQTCYWGDTDAVRLVGLVAAPSE